MLLIRCVNIISHPKESEPIPTPKASTSDHRFKYNSAPHDSLNEHIQRRTTFVNIDNNSTDEQTNSPATNGKRKFVVTPAQEPFV